MAIEDLRPDHLVTLVETTEAGTLMINAPSAIREGFAGAPNPLQN